MNDAYLRHVIPEPQVLLGLSLRPFCAGHIALFHRTHSLFVQPGATPDRLELQAQLVHAIFLCAQTFEEGCAALNDAGTPKFMKRWHAQLEKSGGFVLEDKVEEFTAYIARGSEFPMSYIPRDQSKSVSELPFLHAVRTSLRHFYHLGESEFWNMPWGLALWDYYTVPVINGCGDLVAQSSLKQAQNTADEIHRTWDAQFKAAQKNGVNRA